MIDIKEPKGILQAYPLEKKEAIALDIIDEGLSIAKNPFMVFTGRKDSLVLLHLIRRFQNGRITIPILQIDTTVEFEDIYNYIEKMKKLWLFKLIRERNEEALQKLKIAENKEECCGRLKVEALKNIIGRKGIDYLFMDIRWDESEACTTETFILNKGTHTGIHPILLFTEKDVWDYIKKYNLPYCSLYDRGYKDIQCVPCTDSLKLKDEQNEQKEEEIKKRLKALGYM